MRETMNLFFVFTYYFWKKRFLHSHKIRNPFKYLLDAYKVWGFKYFLKDQLDKYKYIQGLKNIKDILLNKRTVW